MKDPFVAGFWCSTSALVLLTATFLYDRLHSHQLQQAMDFLHSALAMLAVMLLGVIAWSCVAAVQLRRREQSHGRTRVLIWDAKVALRRVETVFDRFFWGGYWQPGRSFQEVINDLGGTPLDSSLAALKLNCRVLDEEMRDGEWHWLKDARELGNVATSLARQRFLLECAEPAQAGEINRELEMLVYTWSTQVRTFEHHLDNLENQYS